GEAPADPGVGLGADHLAGGRGEQETAGDGGVEPGVEDPLRRGVVAVGDADGGGLAGVGHGVSFRMSSSRARRWAQSARWPSIQAWASSSGAGLKLSTWSRPSILRVTRRARSSMRMCLEIEFSEMAKG